MTRRRRSLLVDQMDSIFNPASVAVIGASNTPGKWGFGSFARLLAAGNKRPVYPVNRRADMVLGRKAYPDLVSIPGPVELAIIVVPPESVPAAMRDCVAKGVKAAIVITAGLGEVGEQGQALEREVVRLAREGGIRFVGPNCMGHFNAPAGLFTVGETAGARPGRIACVSQSGNFGGYIIARGSDMGVGFSKFVSTGNEADLRLEDYLEYLAQDEDTGVILAYVEGLREHRRFFSLAKEITRRKPIVMMKSGRTAAGARAAWSHTAALAGADAIHEAAFRQCGVIRVEEVDEMFDLAAALLKQPLPRGRRVGVLTGGGGFGVVAADACSRMGLELAALSDETMETLSKYLPPRWSHDNPVDMAGTSNASYFAMGTLLKSPDVDAVVGISCVGSPIIDVEERAEESVRKLAEYGREMAEAEAGLVDGLVERMHRHGKPLLLAYAPAGSRSPAINRLKEKEVYVYPTPERAVRVLAHLAWYSEYLGAAGAAPAS